MPTYDMYCPKCEKKYEMLLTVKEHDGIVYCPKCGKPHQLVSLFVKVAPFKMRGGTRGGGYK